jgi:rRNA maturation endonuclease Nob1
VAANNWLKEERRKTLGDWVAVCLGCGHAVRYVDEGEAELPESCPACGGEIRSRCPSCSARFSSAFAVACEACGGPLRAPELLGIPIRKSKRRP